MKKKPACARDHFSFAILLIVVSIFSIALKSPLHAGFWDQLNEKLLLNKLIGKGQFIACEQDADVKDRSFPLEVLSDGFRMARVYQDFPGNYQVEWNWRVVLKNRSSRTVELTVEYKLQDQDAFLVASSKEYFKKIDVGETVVLEKTDQLPYETAKRVMSSTWYIHLQNGRGRESTRNCNKPNPGSETPKDENQPHAG